MRNTTHPVMVITDHANLQYYREPQKIGPRVNGYIVELADYNIQLVYKPGASNKADELSWRPDMAPEDEEELVIVLPNHLFAPMESPSKAYVATRTKPEDYSSDSGYESDGTNDTRNVVKKLSDDSRDVIKNLADDSQDVLKDLALENTALKARAANLGDGYIISAFKLDQKIEKAQGKDAQTVTIPAVTPTFSSPSRPTASPEVPRDTSSGHVPLGSHVIYPRAPSSRPMPRDPVSRPRWVQLRESPPSTPDAPDEPESSTDPRIDSAVLTKDLSILQRLLSGLPMSLWSTVMDIDGH